MSDWWKEEQRGQLLGHGIRWGHTLGHVTKITDSGPGAIGMRAICHGIQGVVCVNSGMDINDEAQCTAFKDSYIKLSNWETLDNLPHRKDVCSRCVSIYNRQRAKEDS